MEIVLVLLNNFQEYILDNIHNLLRLQNNDITVIADEKYINHFKEYNINFICVEHIIIDYENYIKECNNTFRNGFWKLTTLRFLIIKEYMKINNKTNIVHIENDVLLYKNINEIYFHNKEKILITMDSEKRCIPGLLFIPNYILLERCYNNFIKTLNDMENWAKCYYELNDIVDTLPIFIENNDNVISNNITKNYKFYNAIFDAAAIGQYLGGIDPRNNDPRNKIGFVNETCIFNYSKYSFKWINNENNIKIPYITISNQDIPIINLHIHSKNLKAFII
tara:strand:- start:5664 stop:6500 length:837 start_codon:yes stop_codon:yes gene_type:complete